VPVSSSPAASATVAAESSDPSVASSAPSRPPPQQTSLLSPEQSQDEQQGSAQDGQPSAPRLAPGELPPQIVNLLVEITTTLGVFTVYPPHTIQRLAELVLNPTAHYRSLTAYLHAMDRIVHVTSGANIYPLPPAIQDMIALSILANGVSGGSDPRMDMNSSSAAATIGSDEALGGALLTPIPWLARRATAATNGSDDGSDTGGGSPGGVGSPHAIVPTSQGQSSQQQSQRRPQVRTESTETIEGPNGVGSIETVSISINGIPSMGAGGGLLAQRGVTQGELLRQEQRAGVVPVSQLARHGQHPHSSGDSPGNSHANGSSPSSASSASSATLSEGTATVSPAADAEDTAMDEDDVPHARGPDEIGAADMGPQNETTSSFTISSGGTLEMHGIDVEAAVGRRAPLPHSPSEQQRTSSLSPPSAMEAVIPSHSPKREAAQDLDSGLHKRIKEEASGSASSSNTEPSVKPEAGVEEEEEKIKVDTEGDVVLTDTKDDPEKKEINGRTMASPAGDQGEEPKPSKENLDANAVKHEGAAETTSSAS
jgi:hypothetical protein